MQLLFLPRRFLSSSVFNTLRPRQIYRHFADDIFKCIFLSENVWFSLKISLTCVPKVPIDNIPPLVQIIAWRRLRHRRLSVPMMVKLLTHITESIHGYSIREENYTYKCNIPWPLTLYLYPEMHHDDVIKWKHFPCYWPFVWGIHRSPVNSPHKASDAELWCFLWSSPE